MAVRDPLLQLSVDFDAAGAGDGVTAELVEAQRKANQILAVEERRATAARTANSERQAMREAAVRRRFAVAAIRDETTRRTRAIDLVHQREIRSIQAVLRERLRTGEITARQAREHERRARIRVDRERDDRTSTVLPTAVGRRAGALGGLGRLGAIAAGGTAAIAMAAGLRRAADVAATFEERMHEVGRATGLTGEQLDVVGEGLLEMAVRLGIGDEKLTDIAAAAGELGVRGREDLLAFTEAAAQMSATTSLSGAEAAAALAEIIRSYRLQATDAERLGSTVLELARSTRAGAADILSIVAEVGVAGDQAGLTAQQVAALGATLVDAGVDARSAGSAIREMLERTAERGATGLEAVTDLLGRVRQGQEEAFGDRYQVAVAALAAEVDGLSENLGRADEAYASNTRLAQSFAEAQDRLSVEWARFTATITQAAIAIGSHVLPLLTGLLRVVNRLTGGGASAADEFQRLSGELQDLGSLEQATRRYQQLESDGLTPASDATGEMRALVDQLAAAYPHFASETDGAGQAMRLYADDIAAAIAQLQELRRQEQLRAVGDVGREFVRAGQRRSAAGTRRMDVRGEWPIETDAEMGERAADAAEDMRQAVRDMADTFRTLAGDADRTQQAVAALTAAGVDEATIARARAAAAAPAGPGPRPTVPPPPRRTPRDRGQERAEDAAEKLSELLEQLNAERIEDELERQLEALRVRFDREREEIQETAKLALTQAGLTGDERRQIHEQERDALAAIDIVAQRESDELREEAAEKRQREEASAAQDRIRAEREIVDERARAEALARDDTRDEHGFKHRLARIDEEFDERRAAAERAFQYDAELLDNSMAEEEERIARREGLELKLSNDLREAELERVRAVARLEEIAAEKRRRDAEDAERQTEDLIAQVRRYSDEVVDTLLDSASAQRAMTEAQVGLQRLAYEEELQALQDSLRDREISQREYDLRVRALTENRAAFEQEVAADSAGFVERTLRGGVGVVREVLREEIKERVAAGLMQLLVHQSTEAGKTTATAAGSTMRQAFNLAEAGTSLYNAAASIVDAVASVIKSIVKVVPFPFNLALIPLGVGAVYGAYRGVRGLLGLAEGGFVGAPGGRGRDTVPAMLGLGEAVLNHHQQQPVDAALRATYGWGLDDLFARERRPHYLASGGFAGVPAPASFNPPSTRLPADMPVAVDLTPLQDELRAMRAEQARQARALQNAVAASAAQISGSVGEPQRARRLVQAAELRARATDPRRPK